MKLIIRQAVFLKEHLDVSSDSRFKILPARIIINQVERPLSVKNSVYRQLLFEIIFRIDGGR